MAALKAQESFLAEGPPGPSWPYLAMVMVEWSHPHTNQKLVCVCMYAYMSILSVCVYIYIYIHVIYMYTYTYYYLLDLTCVSCRIFHSNSSTIFKVRQVFVACIGRQRRRSPFRSSGREHERGHQGCHQAHGNSDSDHHTWGSTWSTMGNWDVPLGDFLWGILLVMFFWDSMRFKMIQ